MSTQVQTTKMIVTGMTCNHCVASVTTDPPNLVRALRGETGTRIVPG